MNQDSRRKARSLALVCQYQRQKLSESTVSEAQQLETFGLSKKNQEFTKLLLRTAHDQRPQIDELIQKNLQGWKQSRLLEPLNALLRISVAELLMTPTTDSKVVFNEAIELCRLYVSEGSTKLLNGVLHAITKEIRPD